MRTKDGYYLIDEPFGDNVEILIINEEKRKIYSSLVRIIGSDASEW